MIRSYLRNQYFIANEPFLVYCNRLLKIQITKRVFSHWVSWPRLQPKLINCKICFLEFKLSYNLVPDFLLYKSFGELFNSKILFEIVIHIFIWYVNWTKLDCMISLNYNGFFWNFNLTFVILHQQMTCWNWFNMEIHFNGLTFDSKYRMRHWFRFEPKQIVKSLILPSLASFFPIGDNSFVQGSSFVQTFV